MQIKNVDPTSRQKLPEELSALARGHAVPSEEGEGVRNGPGQAATDKVVEPANLAQAERAVGAINDVLKVSSTSLQFEVERDAGSTMVIVKVIDKDSGDILRQIPSEEAIRIAKSLDRPTGRLVSLAA